VSKSKLDVHITNIDEIGCKWSIVEWIVPFPRRAAIVIVLINPTDTLDIALSYKTEEFYITR
jgi:hypothetical protein